MEHGSKYDIELANINHADEERLLSTQSPMKHDQRDEDEDGDEDEEEDDLDPGDEGNRALLGSEERTRGRERIGISKMRVLWQQVQNIVIESAPTLLLTTIGLLFTGKLLEDISQWRAMREVDQLIMIIPVVLNLKGNLEMNLSARLGTAANIGELDDPPKRWAIIKGNMTLLQVQAAVVSFVAAIVSFILGMVVPRVTNNDQRRLLLVGNTTPVATSAGTTHLTFHKLSIGPRRPIPALASGKPFLRPGIDTFVMVASTAMSAAALSSLILGSFMCALVVVCRKYGRDPDNIAPPIAACLGDLVTLCLMGVVSTLLIPHIDTPFPLLLVLLVVVGTLASFLFTIRNPCVKGLLTQGWTPLFGAMVISSGTGIVLDLFVSRYEDFAILAIVISGLPGSVGSIFVSRLSTSLHAAAVSLSQVIPGAKGSEPSARVVMFTLLFITVPIEIIFLAILRMFGWLGTPFLFVALSILFFCCAVAISLVTAQWLTQTLWKWERDPDMYALPLHSALMDLVGQLLLVVCFEIASRLGAHVRMRKL